MTPQIHKNKLNIILFHSIVYGPFIGMLTRDVKISARFIKTENFDGRLFLRRDVRQIFSVSTNHRGDVRQKFQSRRISMSLGTLFL